MKISANDVANNRGSVSSSGNFGVIQTRKEKTGEKTVGINQSYRC
jgi:hypothetical protein